MSPAPLCATGVGSPHTTSAVVEPLQRELRYGVTGQELSSHGRVAVSTAIMLSHSRCLTRNFGRSLSALRQVRIIRTGKQNWDVFLLSKDLQANVAHGN